MSRGIAVSGDRRIHDSAPVQISGDICVRQVLSWIKNDPVTLWLAIKRQKLSLARDAHAELKLALEKIYPVLIEYDKTRKKKAVQAKKTDSEKHLSGKSDLQPEIAEIEKFIENHQLHNVDKTSYKVVITKESEKLDESVQRTRILNIYTFLKSLSGSS